LKLSLLFRPGFVVTSVPFHEPVRGPADERASAPSAGAE
jgi:hypothetical protein